MNLRIAIAQINVTVGDLKGNQSKITDALALARRWNVHCVVFPEMAVTGYPPEDLLFKPSFVRDNLAILSRVVPETRDLIALIGFADRDKRGFLYNAALLAAHGRKIGTYHKMMLPNYGVFDEKRYFSPGRRPFVFEIALHKKSPLTRVGISICEDVWVDEGPCVWQAKQGARLMINLSASPYHAGKIREREKLLCKRARSYKSWICYANLVGGQDELIFDGGSLVVNPHGGVHFRAPQFEEGLFLVEVPLRTSPKRPVVSALPKVSFHQSAGSHPLSGKSRSPSLLSGSTSPLSPDMEIFQALVLGTRDYVRKNGFSQVVLGMSGGIDSALTAAIAVAALNRESVIAVSMPSRYSSEGTRADAQRIAERLGIRFLTIPIEPIFQTFCQTLKPLFSGFPVNVTEENLQARIRGSLLMALSNKFRWLVLATGNKSELSTGYCTLYGDMVGGFAVIKDVPKSWVYRLSKTANRLFGGEVIPSSVFKRTPTAELKPHQKDQDTLPPYEHLDLLIKAYVEENWPVLQIQKKGKIPRREISQVVRMIDFNEYKRRQAPIGIKITPKAFGKDRRMPITNRYVEVFQS